jgi:hypothetical protein
MIYCSCKTPTVEYSTNSWHRPESREWLEGIQSSPFSDHLFGWFSSRKIRESVSRIKIAVLDTGYDKKTPFLAEDELRQKCLLGWKDFSDAQEKDAVDQDSHGTQVLSLVMKVAPAAEVYVARIARDRPGLREEGHKINVNVAKVNHAVLKNLNATSLPIARFANTSQRQ